MRCRCGDKGKANLDQSALTHCKGSALAVAIYISNECGVGDAYRGLASDLHLKHSFDTEFMTLKVTAVQLIGCVAWQPSFRDALFLDLGKRHSPSTPRNFSTGECECKLVRDVASIAPPVAPVLLVKMEESRRTCAERRSMCEFRDR